MNRALKVVGVLSALALPAFLSGCGHASTPAPVDGGTVHTSFGPLRGLTLNNGVQQYMGVPFATAKRFGDPADWSSSWDTPRDALQQGGHCKGTEQDSGQEDCLYLNVWGNTAAVLQPVLLFLYGGSFLNGNSADPEYNCSSVASKHHAVYVTSNYRLGSLGFLSVTNCSTDANCHANFGLKDQQSALRWVSREIEAFGGDASRVLLFGQSAGAMSTVYHLVSPSSIGLFARALTESFVDIDVGMDPLVAANASRAFAFFLGCDMGDLECLRKPTVEDIEKAQEAALDAVCGVEDGSLCTELCRESVFMPTIDGTSLPASPLQLLQEGRFNRDVDVVIGSNTNEAGFFAGIVDQPQWEELVRDALFVGLRRPVPLSPVPDRVVQKVLTRYPYSNASAAFFGDFLYICPSEQVVRLLSTFSNNRYRYRYRYNYGSAEHRDEVQYVFDYDSEYFTPTEQAFADDLGAAWANFAGSGVPSEAWLTYINASDLDTILAPGDWQTETGWRTEFCDFWAHLCDHQFCDPIASIGDLII